MYSEWPLPFRSSQVKLSDQVHYGFGREEGGTIADVVNDHKAIGPVDLLFECGPPLAWLHKEITHSNMFYKTNIVHNLY